MTIDLDAADQLATEAEAIAKNATKGYWTKVKPGKCPTTGFSAGVIVAAVARGQCVYSDPPGGSFPAADQDLIVFAGNNTAALAAAVRQLVAECRRLQEAAFARGEVLNMVAEALGAGPDVPPQNYDTVIRRLRALCREAAAKWKGDLASAWVNNIGCPGDSPDTCPCSDCAAWRDSERVRVELEKAGGG